MRTRADLHDRIRLCPAGDSGNLHLANDGPELCYQAGFEKCVVALLGGMT